ncbi:MAG: phage holin family protein [Myxococcales bacterium]|nr:MAG: phage holin family protein [Myxococcales bacterium]
MRILVTLVVHSLALGAAIWLFDDITLTTGDDANFWIQLVLTGAIFALVNSLVKPVVKVLSIPLIILTLGLMLVVINALMLMLTSKLAGVFDLGFHVEGFWTAVLGGIVISVASAVLEAILPSKD